MVGLNSETGKIGAGTGVETGTKEKVAKNVVFHFDTEEKSITFAATVHTTLPIRTASQGVSFAFNTLEYKYKPR